MAGGDTASQLTMTKPVGYGKYFEEVFWTVVREYFKIPGEIQLMKQSFG